VSEHAVALAAAGTTLGLLEATVSRRGSAIRALSPVTLPRLPVSPLQVMSLTSLALGAYRARAVAREELPSPTRRTSWHALPADDVLGRLDTERSAADGTDREPAPPGPDRAPGPVGTTARGGADLARAVFSELRDLLTPVLLTGSAASAMLGSPVDAALVGGVTAPPWCPAARPPW
jgi:cation-transporting ATPase I